MILADIRHLLAIVLVLVTSGCASAPSASLQQTDDTADIRSDDYIPWMRAIGLYPLTRIPVALGYARWQKEYLGEVKAWSGENVTLWQPVGDAPALVRKNAPVFLVKEEGLADRFGYPEPRGGKVVIDTALPVVTWRLGETTFKEQRANQISYTLWFPERPSSRALDLKSGSLDSVIFRVTLGPDGTPILYDTIHGCGCYHLFFPVPPTRRKPMPEDNDLREEAFVPFEAPVLKAGERLGVRITSGAHYVVGLEALGATRDQSYELLNASDVTQGIAHLYDRNGILPQSKRLERFILWPMGIRSPGAMRAWGRHATAFVGKRHFDDHDLLDRAFE